MAGAVPRPVLLAYGLPGLPLAAVLLPLFVYLPTFYAENLGLGFALVGSLLLAARLTDMVTDPLVGALSDRFGWPLGRRRSWMLFGVPLLLIAAHRLFLPPEDAGAGYLLGWSIAAYLGATLVQLPYSAWGAEISGDYNERSRISGAREGFVVLGTLLAAGLPALLTSDPRDALATIGWLLIVLLPLAVTTALVVVPESRVRAQRALGWRQGLSVLYRNRPFRRLLAAYFLNSIANGLPATLFLLFVGHVLQASEWAGALLFVYFACGVAAIPLWLKLSAAWGKHRAWIVAMSANTAIFALVPLLGAGDQWWFLAICITTGVALGADLTLPASMQADVVDLDTLKSGRQRTGLYFALWGIVTKLALALAVGIAFPLLELAGFTAGAASQTPDALFALAALYSLVPSGIQAGRHRTLCRVSHHRRASAAHPAPDRVATWPRWSGGRGVVTRTIALLLVIMTLLTGCSNMKPEDFEGQEPRFRIEEYFAGKTRAWGIFQDRFGKLRRQFVVDIDGRWDGETLTLVENFAYNDGKTEQRTWTIKKTGEHSYEGTADGVIGVAEGKSYGNVLNWRYRFALQVGDSTWNVTFDDWMFLQGDGVMINRAVVSKFGIELGEVTISFRKDPTDSAATAPAAPRVFTRR